jgi:hypothetical protein
VKHHEIKLDYHEDETTKAGTTWFREWLVVDDYRYPEPSWTYMRFSTRKRYVQKAIIHAFTRQLS